MQTWIFLLISCFGAVRTLSHVTHICVVNARIDTTTIATVRGLQEVEKIVLSTERTLINIAGTTLNVGKVLENAGYAYMVEENHPLSLNAVTSEWNLDRIDELDYPLDGRYDPIGTGENIQIYVLDTGVNAAHNEFGGRVSRDFKLESPCTSDVSSRSHGSWVASIAAGSTFGVAKLAQINDVKLPNGASCSFDIADAIEALIWLLTRPAPFIVTMSWNTVSSPSVCIDNLVQDLRNHGAFLVAAAGNGNTLNGACGISPARSPSALTVAAVSGQTNDDVRAGFSNYGDCIWGFAPGVDINGASGVSNSDSVNFDGTSASVPHVAGMAATFMTRFGLTTPDEIDAKLASLAVNGRVENTLGTTNRLLNFADAGMLSAVHTLLLSLTF